MVQFPSLLSVSAPGLWLAIHGRRETASVLYVRCVGRCPQKLYGFYTFLKLMILDSCVDSVLKCPRISEAERFQMVVV